VGTSIKIKQYGALPNSKNWKPTGDNKYVEEIHILKQEFMFRFQDFLEHDDAFSLFSSLFGVNVKTVADEFQLEIIDVECNKDLKSKLRVVTLLDFCKLYLPGDK
jgi:hypothetical protein